eukprot:snap_masked-scaffold_64-processed-gene-0.39-mRNA-1 protein AED:1.00 eAED:1.00 QI:0/0/0/0/1/1/2/0/78
MICLQEWKLPAEYEYPQRVYNDCVPRLVSFLDDINSSTTHKPNEIDVPLTEHLKLLEELILFNFIELDVLEDTTFKET